ncbi:alpha-E domain-containing protein [Euzebya tangerina]|uniref:alpha-E domain-containing protein n=1 Tax=Euzebya tangerina TaxID=591198 RepID=UPI00196BA86E|nr:alpha-E domain-containing protein [Euzebya tangerina]
MLLSRLAEHVYWAGRYLERAEATARLVRAQTELFLDLPSSAGVGFRPMLAVTGSADAFVEEDEWYDDGVSATEEHQIVRFLTTSSHHPGSVLQCIAAARQNLRSVRALLPRSGWEVANRLHLFAQGSKDLAVPRRSRLEWLTDIIEKCQTLSGVLDGTMSHDNAYKFLQVGRHLERADMTTRVIDVQATTLLGYRVGDGKNPYADITWMAVLRSLSAMQMFRRVARAGVNGPHALAFLLSDHQFPRSVEFNLTALSQELLELPRHELTMAACADAQSSLVNAVITDLSGRELHALMDTLQTQLARVHDAAQTTWFSGDPDDLPKIMPLGTQAQTAV